MTIIYSGDNITFNDQSLQNTAATGFGFKNRIINGAMVIDQRNNGASVTPNNSYTLDRWAGANTQTSKFTVQQNAGAVTPPLGFTKYLGVTSSSAFSVATTDTFLLRQAIEGFNTADLGFGAANASTVTLSFWVRSSLTGTFGGALVNGGTSFRAYPFSYTISVANTWEQKTVTIAGDTSGTWATDNNAGIELRLGLGSGSTFTGTAGSWQAGNFVQPTGTVSVVGTSGATFYITGVQLEKGSTATAFDYRDFGRELILCQRYLPVVTVTEYVGTGQCFSAVNARCSVQFPVSARVAPTGLTNIGGISMSNSFGTTTGSVTYAQASTLMASISATGLSGLTAGNATMLIGPGSLQFTGCEL